MFGNTALTAISHLSRLLANITLFIVTARVWGPSTFGNFAYWYVVGGLIGLFSDLGAQNLLLSKLVEKHDNAVDLLGRFASLRLHLAGILIILGLAAMPFFDQKADYQLFLLLSITGLLTAFSEIFLISLRAQERYRTELMLSMSCNTLVITIPVATALFLQNPLYVALSLVITRLLTLSVMAITCRRIIGKYRLTWPIGTIYQTFKESFPYAVDGVITNITANVDTLLVKHLLTYHDVGLYQAGARLLQGGLTVAPVMASVFLPNLSRAFQQNDFDTLNQQRHLLAKRLGVVGVVGFLSFTFFGSQISHLLYGAKFSDLNQYMPLFGLLLLARLIAATYSIVLNATASHRVRLASGFLSLCFFIGLGWFIAPYLGIKGILLAGISAAWLIWAFYFFGMKRFEILNHNLLKVSWVEASLFGVVNVTMVYLYFVNR